jgi:hypothetical protein
MPSKIIGISGSPVKKGNVDAFLGSIMDLATEKGLDTETTHLSHILAFFTLDLIPATNHASISPMGAAAVASIHGGIGGRGSEVGSRTMDEGRWTKGR